MSTQQTVPTEAELLKVKKIDLVAMVKDLGSKVQDLSAGKRVITHNPRPNVKYRVLEVPPGFREAPQINQMLIALSKESKKLRRNVLTEPEVFNALEQAKQSGDFRTTQSAPRVFQYYRRKMINLKVLAEFAGEEKQAA